MQTRHLVITLSACAAQADGYTQAHKLLSSGDHISFTNLFAKLPWPGDSQMTICFSSHSHQPTTSTTPSLNLHTVPLMLNVKQESCEYQFLKSSGMTRQGNKPRSTDCKADALYYYTITTQSSIAELANSNEHIPINKNDCPKQWALIFLFKFYLLQTFNK